MQMTKPTIMRILMVRKLIDEPIHWKSILVIKQFFPAQSLTKLITLNEYMPMEIRMMNNILVTCYHVDKEKIPTKPIMMTLQTRLKVYTS
jgi:hypothetical protein